MSTIDMNQVAGLQAVDAEGNVIGTLSVDDLTNLVANNLVKSTQNQIAAQSVSTLSDATTLAASDEYENTLPVDDNPKSVRTLDAAGNPKQTGINALATVVGGLLSSQKLYPFMSMNRINNINTAIKPGMYAYGASNIPGNPIPSQQYGILVVFEGVLSSKQRIVVQILRPNAISDTSLYIRIGTLDLDYTEFTDINKWISYTGIVV